MSSVKEMRRMRKTNENKIDVVEFKMFGVTREDMIRNESVIENTRKH